jgi:hypothetical protein
LGGITLPTPEDENERVKRSRNDRGGMLGPKIKVNTRARRKMVTERTISTSKCTRVLENETTTTTTMFFLPPFESHMMLTAD